jgi:hypothetical protein
MAPAMHPEVRVSRGLRVSTRRGLPPACLARGAGKVASLAAQPRQYTPSVHPLRSQRTPQPSHTFRSKRKWFISFPFERGSPLASLGIFQRSERARPGCLEVSLPLLWLSGRSESGCETHGIVAKYVTSLEKQFHPTVRFVSILEVQPWTEYRSNFRLPFEGRKAGGPGSCDRFGCFPRMESREFIALDKMRVNHYLFLMNCR